MYDPKMTLTGAGTLVAWVIAFGCKHFLNLEVPDEVSQGIVVIGLAIMGKFGRDSSRITNSHDDAANTLIHKALADSTACIDNMTKQGNG